LFLRKSGGNPEEIRCQFIILEIRRKSGVSSSFLPEKTNRHRITSATPDYVRKDKLTPDYVEKIN